MLLVLTGIGLAAAAGLNAYIPLLAIAVLARFTDVITLPPDFTWLENGWTIGILSVLLIIEVVADKIPGLDHINDIIHTVIRPGAGGIAFGAATTSTTVVDDPETFFTTHQWIPVAAGIVIGLAVHGAKAAARPAVNVTTAGFGAPVASATEDAFSITMVLVAIFLPLGILVVLALLGWFLWALRRRRRKRKAEKAELEELRAAARQGRLTPPPRR